MDIQNEPFAGSCRLIAVLSGYESSEINLAAFMIGQDLKLPELVLTPRPPLLVPRGTPYAATVRSPKKQLHF